MKSVYTSSTKDSILDSKRAFCEKTWIIFIIKTLGIMFKGKMPEQQCATIYMIHHRLHPEHIPIEPSLIMSTLMVQIRG